MSEHEPLLRFERSERHISLSNVKPHRETMGGLTETKSPHIGRTSQNEVLMQRILKHKRKVKTMKKISTFTANVRHSHYNGERQEITVSADSYGSAECRVKSIMKDYAKKEGLTKGRFVIDDMKCDNGIYLF